MSKTIFLYGPQTSGKTTRLLRIIKRDHGKDILMSGEDSSRVTNGREVCDVTLRAPENYDRSSLSTFKRKAIDQFPVKHILIDGAQFFSKDQLLILIKIFNGIDSNAPIIFSGCRYYVASPGQKDDEIPTSRFLMTYCDKAIPVDRPCDFCNQLATRLYITRYKHLAGHKIVAVDPHLVCDVHYQKLKS